MSTDSANNTQAPSASQEQGLPEQRHAGQVGYGPNYHAGPTMGDKIEGLKEELKGKITRNHDRVQHGHEILSGEEKRKKLTGEDEPNPFQNADDDSDKDSKSPSGPGGPPARTPSQSHSQDASKSNVQLPRQTNAEKDDLQLGQPNTSGPPRPNAQGMGLSDHKGAKEQAATVAPQGTQEAHTQRQGGAVDHVKSIG